MIVTNPRAAQTVDPPTLEFMRHERPTLEGKVPAYVQHSLRDAQEDVPEAFLTRQKELHDFYGASFAAHTRHLLKRLYPAHADEMNDGDAKHQYLNVTKMTTKTLAVMTLQRPETYLKKAGERLPETDPQMQLWRRDERDVRFWSTLQAVERETSLFRTLYVQAAWKRGRPRWVRNTPYQVLVERDPDDPGRLERAVGIHVRLRQTKQDERLHPGATVSWMLVRDIGDDGETTERWEAFYWDEAGNRFPLGLFDDDAARTNEYGLHPFAVFHDEEPSDGQLLLPMRDDLWAAQRYIIRSLVMMGVVGDYQGFSVPVLEKWESENRTPKIGPGIPLVGEGEGTFRWETPAPNIAALEAMAENFLRRYAVAEGLPSNIWSAQTVTQNLSTARLLRQPLEERRVERVDQMNESVAQLWRAHKAVCNYHRREKYDDDVELCVDWKPVPMPSDPFQEAQANTQRFEQGVWSPVDQVMLEQRVPREEAERIVERNHDYRKRFGLSGGPPLPAHPPGAPRSPDVRDRG